MISNIIKEIDNILKLDIDTVENTDMTTYDLTEWDIIKKYGWGSTQQALFQILLDNNYSYSEYYTVAEIFWNALLDYETDKDTAVALLNYRLSSIENPYENNLVWSITQTLYNLDYCYSDYNALKDDKIILKLKKLGINL